MNVKVLGFLCFILVLDGVLSAKIPKKDVDKKAEDEEVYGDLDGNNPDIQKDTEYYDEDGAESPPEEDTGGAENEVDVKLLSKPESFTQNIPGVVLLPCQASSSDDVVRVWTKDTTPLFQGTINIQNRKNLKVLNGSLQVTLQNDSDYGKYACKLAISETSQPEIVHEIVKEERPSIVALYANDNKTSVVLNSGDLLTLTCQATGSPKPKISWHRNNERLGTEGEMLTIQTVRPKHAGSYRCLADNKVGQPDHKHIDVNVNHAPIVSVEKYIVNSDHKNDVEFVCEVKAYPVPVVNWQKNGENLVNQEPKIKLSRQRNNERNILIITDINETDFGHYACVASNALGKQVRNVALVKTPALVHFEKALNETTKYVILKWRVQSKQRILMHELQYRRKGEQSWKTLSPEVTEGESDVYLIKQTLKSLEPGVYETRARSKNSHGWSDFSEIMPFEGVKHSSHHQKSKHVKKEQKELKTADPTHDTPAQHRSEEITPLGASTSSSTPLHSSSIFLVPLILFATYFHVRQ